MRSRHQEAQGARELAILARVETFTHFLVQLIDFLGKLSIESTLGVGNDGIPQLHDEEAHLLNVPRIAHRDKRFGEIITEVTLVFVKLIYP